MFHLIFVFLFISNLAFAQDYHASTYQIGSEWGKVPVTADLLRGESPAFQRAAYATAFLPAGGTGFYLGKFNGFHILATNHHVCSIGAVCLNNYAEFSALNRRYKMTKFLGTMKPIDLTLLSLEVPAADEESFLKVARNFSFQRHLNKGDRLMTFGYGVAENPKRALTANQDADCRVFSESGDVRLMEDPDTMNPLDYSVWSFANGCDVSHGDSGSPMLDRNTGELIGILWTGTTPKPAFIQDSSFLNQLLRTPSEEVWSSLSYAVPADKMPPVILDYAEKYPWIDEATRTALREMVTGI